MGETFPSLASSLSDQRASAQIAIPLREAAKLVGCHRDTLWRAIMAGWLSAYYAGGSPVSDRVKRGEKKWDRQGTRIMVFCDSLMAWVRARMVPARKPK